MIKLKTDMSDKLVATVVPDNNRLAFLPLAFASRMMIRAECMIYQQADLLSDDYNGGLWNFYTLSNGGYYVAPASPASFDVAVDGNGYQGNVSADAFGIIVTLFVYGALAWIPDDTLQDKYSNHYHQLRAFAAEHAEAGAILSAID